MGSSTDNKCPFVCGRTFATAHLLQIHLERTSGQCTEQQYKCPHKCGKIYTTYSRLRIHLESTGGRCYQCLICHKTFNRGYHLRRHAAVHNSKKPVTQPEIYEQMTARPFNISVRTNIFQSPS
jgi:hypothetical protein